MLIRPRENRSAVFRANSSEDSSPGVGDWKNTESVSAYTTFTPSASSSPMIPLIRSRANAVIEAPTFGSLKR